jgi:hypothetical protein
MIPQLSVALTSSVAFPEATPVSFPMSVPGDAAVTQVREPNGEGDVNLAPIERTVPNVVPAVFSMLRDPAVSTTTGSSEQLLNDHDAIGPLTAVPVNIDVVPLMVEAVHVFAKPPNVPARRIDVPDFTDSSIVIAPDCVSPRTWTVVADAVSATACSAEAIKTTGTARLSFMISPSFSTPGFRCPERLDGVWPLAADSSSFVVYRRPAPAVSSPRFPEDLLAVRT